MPEQQITTSNPRIELIEEMNGCKFNPGGVQCNFEDCDMCGWNPKVAQKRNLSMRMKRAEKTGHCFVYSTLAR